MKALKLYLSKVFSWLIRGRENLDLCEKFCVLSQELAAEVEKRTRAEKQLATCNRLLLAHNGKLREILQNQVMINDTSKLLGEMAAMVNDMRGILDVAAEMYEKTPESSL